MGAVTPSAIWAGLPGRRAESSTWGSDRSGMASRGERQADQAPSTAKKPKSRMTRSERRIEYSSMRVSTGASWMLHAPLGVEPKDAGSCHAFTQAEPLHSGIAFAAQGDGH